CVQAVLVLRGRSVTGVPKCAVAVVDGHTGRGRGRAGVVVGQRQADRVHIRRGAGRVVIQVLVHDAEAAAADAHRLRRGAVAPADGQRVRVLAAHVGVAAGQRDRAVLVHRRCGDDNGTARL